MQGACWAAATAAPAVICLWGQPRCPVPSGTATTADDTTWTDDASISSSPTQVKVPSRTAAVSRSAAVVYAGDKRVAAGPASRATASFQQQAISSRPYFSQTMAALDKPYKLTLADIANGRTLAKELTRNWVGPDGRRRERQPGDLAPHIAQLQDTQSALLTACQLYKATARRGNRRTACRAVVATGACDICCAWSCWAHLLPVNVAA